MPLLDINIEKSKLQCYFLLGFTIVSSICILMTALSLTIQILFFSLLIGYTGLLFSQRYNVFKIQVTRENTWVIFAKSKRYIGRLRGESLITHHLCILRFNIENKRYPLTCVIYPDAIKKDQFRQLIVKIRTLIDN